jgi:hypothetical protein
LIGYEYRPLSEPVYFGGIGERDLVAIATSDLFGRIAVDVASGHVAQIPMIESVTASHVNRDLVSFNRCVTAVIARFPFYAEGDEERYEEAAEELRDLGPVLGLGQPSRIRPVAAMQPSARSGRYTLQLSLQPGDLRFAEPGSPRRAL